jgi:hypothetical protein
MDGNECDYITLDEYLLPMLSTKAKGTLEKMGYLGNYVFCDGEICWRTEIALRAEVSSPEELHIFAMKGQKVSKEAEEEYKAFHDEFVKKLREDIEGQVTRLKSKAFSDRYGQALRRRWKQIELLLAET